MKFVLTLLGLLLLTLGGMLLLAHHDTTQRVDAEFKKFAPVSASFSRFGGDKEHVVSVYWRLHFPGKKHPMREAVAYWSLRPFRHVTLVTK